MRKLMLLVALTLLPTPADASCAYVGMEPVVLTRRDTKLPADGGVLIGYAYGNGEDGTHGADPSDVKWTATSGKAAVTLVRTQLAPGLSVYRPAANVSAFKLAGKTAEHGSYTHEAKSAPFQLAAPAPKAVSASTTEGFRSTTTVTTLTLTAAPPAEAVAIIGYDATGAAKMFATLPDTHDKLLEFVIDTTGGHCGTPKPEGYERPYGKIAFAYVDAFGRVSAKSALVAVK